MEDFLNKKVVQVFAHGKEGPCISNSGWHLRLLCSWNDNVEQEWIRLCEDGGPDIACNR
jgi:hypothetical protein